MTVEVLRYAAFTDGGAGGNPAGVVLGASLTDAQMLAVARAIGYSETAFLVSDEGVHRLRFFSPRAELDFCGHATIATAVVLAERYGIGTRTFETRSGPIVVSTDTGPDGALVATLTSVPTSAAPVADTTLALVLEHLRISPADLDPVFPAHVAFGGNHHLVLGVAAESTLSALSYDYDALDDLMATERWTTVHVFWRRDDTTYLARNLFPPGGVVEDPATGAAAAAFGGYLRDLGLTPVPGRLTILQGAAMGSSARLLVDVDASPRVRVTGSATRIHVAVHDYWALT